MLITEAEPLLLLFENCRWNRHILRNYRKGFLIPNQLLQHEPHGWIWRTIAQSLRFQCVKGQWERSKLGFFTPRPLALYSKFLKRLC